MFERKQTVCVRLSSLSSVSMMTFLFLIIIFSAVTSFAQFTGYLKDEYYSYKVGALIELFAPGSEESLYSSMTDENGKFVFENISSGEYSIRISLSGYPVQWFCQNGNTIYPECSLALPVSYQDLLITMSPVDNSIKSVVKVILLDSTFTTANISGTVSLINESGNVAVRKNNIVGTDTIVFDHVVPGNYAIYVETYSMYPSQYYDPVCNSLSPKYITVNQDSLLNIKFILLKEPRGDGYISGVCYTKDGQPAQNVIASLYNPNDTFTPKYTRKTSENGIFLFDYIAVGNYYLKFSSPVYPTQWYCGNTFSTGIYPEGMVSTIYINEIKYHITLSDTPVNNEARGILNVVLKDSNNKTIQNRQSVTMVQKNLNRSIYMNYDTVNYNYKAENLASGEYYILIEAEGYAPQYYSPEGNTDYKYYAVSIIYNETSSYEIILTNNFKSVENYGYITGTVSNSYGPTGSCTINVYSDTGLVMQLLTASDGIIPLQALKSSTYYITLGDTYYKYWSFNGVVMDKYSRNNFYVPVGATLNMNITLLDSISAVEEQSASISGFVRDESGLPVRKTRVLLLSEAVTDNYISKDLNSFYTTETNDSGKYIFPMITNGNYYIFADPDSQNYVAQFYPGVDLPSLASAVNISGSGISNLNFVMRKGGILKGRTIDNSGKGIGNVKVYLSNSQNSRLFMASSSTDGYYQINGISSGLWNVSFHHESCFMAEGKSYEYQIGEDGLTAASDAVLEPGGYLSGILDFSTVNQTAVRNVNDFNITLHDQNSSGIYPVQTVPISLVAGSTSNSSSFVAGLFKTGNWRLVLAPTPLSYTNTSLSETVNFLPGYAWSSPVASITNLNNVYNVNALDTIKNIVFNVRNGYSLFGKLIHNNVAFTNSFNVIVYVKQGDTLLQVSSSYGLKDNPGKFEIPGIAAGERYYIQVFASGFPPQFWSPSGSSINPENPYVLDTITYIPLNITLSDTLKDENNYTEIPVNLWYEKQTDGTLLLKWTTRDADLLDSFFVYSRDNDFNVTLLSKIKAQSGTIEYSYKETRVITKETHYIITGKNSNITLKSNIVNYHPGYNSSTEVLWLDAVANVNNILVKWGFTGNTEFNETDSVLIFRNIDGGNWQLLFRRPAYERICNDYNWDRSDSGKVFGYKIELNTGSLVSDVKYITIDNSVISGLSNKLYVGKYEEYQSIQQALDAAKDYDVIIVRSGTYKEKVNFKGKSINLFAEWEYGKPPVLDAMGDTAIVIPYNSRYSDYFSTSVEGLKIQNAKVGIAAASNTGIHMCLFVNVSQAISVHVDSLAIFNAMLKNPFIPNGINIYTNHCNFIARSAGNIVANVITSNTSDSIKNLSQFLINPMMSLSANVHLEKSIFYQYFSKAASSVIPVKHSGNSFNIRISDCNFWETSKTIPVSNIYTENIISQDPLFIDTLTYFLPDNSTLKTMGIGYDSFRKDDDSNRPSAIKNLQSRILSMSSVGLIWDTPPVSEKIAYYIIYRVPADTNLFYVNEKQEWDLKSKEDVEGRFPEFKTNNNWFIDSTVETGVHYIYAVASVDSNDNEGYINFSAAIPISGYAVNKYEYTRNVKGQNWYMISQWGDSTINVSDSITLYHWDDKTIATSLLSQYSESRQIVPNVGYWCKTHKDTVLSVKNVMLNRLKLVQDTLKCKLVRGITGWNQIASPFPFPVYPSWLSTSAVWEWNADSMGYKRANCLKPWNSYWINVDKDTSLLFLNKSWPVSGSTSMAKKAGVLWEMNLSMRGKSGWDPENRFGVVTGALSKASALQTLEPPSAFGISQLFFLNSTEDKDNNKEKLASLYKSASDKKMEWLVGITASDNKSVIEVQGLENLPKGTFAAWISGNYVQDLKEKKNIVIEPNENTRYGLLLITSDARDIAIYRKSFHIRTPYPNPFRGNTRIEYFIPYQFMDNGMILDGDGVHVNISVYNLAGRKVKTLVNSKIGVGSHSVVWNGTDNSMQRVSAGLYMVKLQSQSFNKTVKTFRVR